MTDKNVSIMNIGSMGYLPQVFKKIVPVYEDDAFEDIENKPHAIKLAPEAVYTYSYTVEVG